MCWFRVSGRFSWVSGSRRVGGAYGDDLGLRLLAVDGRSAHVDGLGGLKVFGSCDEKVSEVFVRTTPVE